jgi:hypothetical protein
MALPLAACGDDGPARGDVELRLLFEVDSLDRPGSVAWDAPRSRYLVTSTFREPSAGDRGGAVAAVSADGDRVERRRFSSSTPGLRLDGPTGIAVRGDRAYVADVHRVVALDLRADTGLYAVEIPESDALKDVAAGPDGTVYASDPGGDAVFVVAADGGEVRRLETAGSLRRPAGLVHGDGGEADAGGLLVAGSDGAILRLGLDGSVSLVAEPREAAALEGIQPDGQGGILFTDPVRGTLERLPPGGRTGSIEPELWLEDLRAPADFLLEDSTLALPETDADRVRVYRLRWPDPDRESGPGGAEQASKQ